MASTNCTGFAKGSYPSMIMGQNREHIGLYFSSEEPPSGDEWLRSDLSDLSDLSDSSDLSDLSSPSAIINLACDANRRCHRTCVARRDSGDRGKESRQKCKNPGGTRASKHFLNINGEDRTRTIAKYYRNSKVLPLGGADSGAVVVTPEDFTSSTSVLMDSDLTAIIEAWPTLDTSVRESILEMICRCS